MNDKGNKTFSDLFLNSKDDNTSNDNDKFTFENLSEEVDNVNNADKVSFNGFTTTLNDNFDLLKDDKKDNLINSDSKLDFNNILSVNENSNEEEELLSDAKRDNVLDGINDNFIINEDKKVDENNELSNSIISATVSPEVFDMVDSEPKDNVINSLPSESILDDSKSELEITENIFGFDDNSNNSSNNFNQFENPSTSIKDNNSLLEKIDVGVNKMDTNVKKSVGNNLNVESPFFENANMSNIEDNPLFANNVISLERNNSEVKAGNGKINLTNTKNFQVKVVPKKEPLFKFIIGVISYAFFIWLLLIGITLLVYVLDIKIRAAKGDYSAPTFNAYVVLTGSMLPDIQVNDVVVTKKVDAEELEVGDIITFASADSRFSGTIITHRIIKKNPASDKGGITFQTKGDNNNVADSTLVPEANIFGKVILKIPKLGYLQEFLASDGGWIIVILIPCLTVISYDIVKLAKGLKRRKNNNIKVKK